MNAEQLLQHFERISEAPDAIKQLRRFILYLAVRGKLVEQEPSDEPAAELLKRIAAEKARMVKAGDIKTKKVCEPSMAEAMYLLPSTWKWVALGSVFDYDAGIKIEPKKLDQNLWLLELEDVEKDTGRLVARVRASERTSQSTKSEFKANDILYGKLRPYLNKVLVADEQGYSTTEIVAIRPYIPLCSKYCVLALRRPDFLDYVTRLGQGTKMPRLRTEDAKVAPFPLPPLAEQHRIVVKVDELMSLCDQLEAAKAEREQCRDSLVAASLQGLNQPAVEEETFREHARFTFNSLPRITTRAAHIKQLRQTILNLAVRGKLAEQDPSEDKVAMRYQNELGGEEIPETWRVLNFGKYCNIEGGNQPPKSMFIDEPRSGYIRLFQIRDLGDRPVPVYIPAVLARSLCKEGEILIGRYGASIGKIFWAKNGAYNVAMAKFICPDDAFVPRFAFFLLKSEYLQGPLNTATRSAQAGFNKSDLAPINFPLPPLAEQHRIVAKVDELMAICDQLEAQITATEQDSRRFLESVLADALAPGIDLSAEAQVA